MMTYGKRGIEMIYQQIASIIFILIILSLSIAFVSRGRNSLRESTQCKEIALLIAYAGPSTIQTSVPVDVDASNHQIMIKNSNVKCNYYSAYKVKADGNTITIIRY